MYRIELIMMRRCCCRRTGDGGKERKSSVVVIMKTKSSSDPHYSRSLLATIPDKRVEDLLYPSRMILSSSSSIVDDIAFCMHASFFDPSLNYAREEQIQLFRKYLGR